MDERRMSFRKVLYGATKGLLVAAALLGLAEGLLLFFAVRKEKRVETRWAASRAGSLEKLYAQMPRTRTNASAKALEEAAVALGAARREPDGRLTNTPLPAGANEYVLAESQKPAGSVAPPPEALAAFLRDHAADLDSVRRTLSAGPAPVWDSIPEELYRAPLPALIPVLNLQRLLAADALAALAGADATRALADAEAGWALNQVTLARPELICKLTGLATIRIWAGVLRKMPAIPEAWPARLKAFDPWEHLRQACRCEATFLYMLGQRGGVEILDAKVLEGGFLDALAGPYVRLCLADTAGRLLEMVEAFEARGRCGGPYETVGLDAEKAIPSWNVVGRVALPNLADAWARADRLGLDLELTERALQIKGLRTAEGGWPASAPQGFEKSLCPKARWTFATQGGGFTIVLENGPEFPEKATWATLPLRYEEPAPLKTAATRGQ